MILRASVVCAVALALNLTPLVGRAQTPAKVDDQVLASARAQYDKARKYGQEGKFEEARKLLEETWASYKHWEVAAYLARAELKTGHYRSAAEHSAYALRVIPRDAYPKERDQLETQYLEAKARVATVQLQGVESDAAVLVDGRTRDATLSADPLFFDAGTHEIEVRRSGRPSTKRSLRPEAGSTTTLDMSPETAATPPPTAAPPKSPTDYGSVGSTDYTTSGWKPRTYVVVAEGALALVAAGVGIGFAVKADTLNTDAKNLMTTLKSTSPTPCSVPSSQCTEVASKYDDRDQAATTAKIAIVSAGVLGVATVATLLLWPKSKSGTNTGSRYWALPGAGGGAGAGSTAGITVGGAF
jgi:hypothetical protein